jgi:hypothetical protein
VHRVSAAATWFRTASAARQGIVVGTVATVLLIAFDVLVRDERTPIGDDRIYELMAQHPGQAHTFPFAFRILVPDLVHVLPFSHTVSFTLLAWLCSGGAAGVLYVLLRRFDIPVWLAGSLALGFAISPYLLIVSLRQGRNSDAMTILVMMAGTLAIVDRRPRAFAAILLVGAFVRESTLFLIPFAYAVWAQRPIDRTALRDTLLSGAPAVIAYVVLRLALPTVGENQVVGYGESFVDGRMTVLRTALEGPGVELRRMFLAFGPLWLALPLAFRGLRFARAGLVLLGLCVVAMLFALDWGRVIFLAAPVVYVSAAWVLRDRRRWAIAAVVALFALNIGYAGYMNFHGVQHGIDDNRPSSYPVQ